MGIFEDKELAKNITAEIDRLLSWLGDLIQNAQSENDADAIHAMIETTSEYLTPKQIGDIWDYLVDWETVCWANAD